MEPFEELTKGKWVGKIKKIINESSFRINSEFCGKNHYAIQVDNKKFCSILSVDNSYVKERPKIYLNISSKEKKDINELKMIAEKMHEFIREEIENSPKLRLFHLTGLIELDHEIEVE